jgi:hypothetical protein
MDPMVGANLETRWCGCLFGVLANSRFALNICGVTVQRLTRIRNIGSHRRAHEIPAVPRSSEDTEIYSPFSKPTSGFNTKWENRCSRARRFVRTSPPGEVPRWSERQNAPRDTGDNALRVSALPILQDKEWPLAGTLLTVSCSLRNARNRRE